MNDGQQEIYINLDDSGKLTIKEHVSVYGGLVFFSKKEKDKIITQYRSIVKKYFIVGLIIKNDDVYEHIIESKAFIDYSLKRLIKPIVYSDLDILIFYQDSGKKLCCSSGGFTCRYNKKKSNWRVGWDEFFSRFIYCSSITKKSHKMALSQLGHAQYSTFNLKKSYPNYRPDRIALRYNNNIMFSF